MVWDTGRTWDQTTCTNETDYFASFFLISFEIIVDIIGGKIKNDLVKSTQGVGGGSGLCTPLSIIATLALWSCVVKKYDGTCTPVHTSPSVLLTRFCHFFWACLKYTIQEEWCKLLTLID